MISLTGYESRRQRLLKRAPAGPVQQYLSNAWPARDCNALEVSMLALDLETSGLEPQTDDIISLGWAPVNAGRISLRSARHVFVKPRRALPPASVVIHGIGDDRAAGGRALAPALEELLQALTGRVLVGHHISMDVKFLQVACRNLGWGKLALPCVDTLVLAERLARHRQRPLQADALTLGELRKSYGLPRYPAHDALWDAIAAAELWLAVSAALAGAGGQLKLSQVLKLRS